VADINHVISLGIGSPAAIQEFLTFGLQQGAATIVPDVVGETQAQATIDIEALGLTVSVSTAYSSSVAAGLVISQNPTGGSSVAPGSDVAIVVSLGEAPATGGGGGGSAVGGWSGKFEFKKAKKAKKPKRLIVDPVSAITEPEVSAPIIETDDDEAIELIMQYEDAQIRSFLSRLKI
jgi:hypothetical protein